jgi:hypothetical protein
MTTIISRLYSDSKTAHAVAANLQEKGLETGAFDIITQEAGSVAERLKVARVSASSAAAYAPMIAQGHALLVVRAPFAPIGLARSAMEIMDWTPSMRVPGAVPNEYIREEVDDRHYISVLTSHPRFFSQDINPGSGIGPGLASRAFGVRLLSPHREKRSASGNGGRNSRVFWPLPLLSRPKERRSAIPGGAYMSRWFWPMPLVTRKGG